MNVHFRLSLRDPKGLLEMWRESAQHFFAYSLLKYTNGHINLFKTTSSEFVFVLTALWVWSNTIISFELQRYLGNQQFSDFFLNIWHTWFLFIFMFYGSLPYIKTGVTGTSGDEIVTIPKKILLCGLNAHQSDPI